MLKHTMDESKEDQALSEIDSESKMADELESITKLPKTHNEVDEMECYKMKNFAGSNNSATSLRLGSEEFEHISVSCIEDIDVPNGEEDVQEKNEEQDTGSGDMEKLDSESKYVECSNLEYTKDRIMESKAKNPVVSCAVNDECDHVDDVDTDNVKGGMDEPDCCVNDTSGLKKGQDGLANYVKVTDNSNTKVLFLLPFVDVVALPDISK